MTPFRIDVGIGEDRLLEVEFDGVFRIGVPALEHESFADWVIRASDGSSFFDGDAIELILAKDEAHLKIGDLNRAFRGAFRTLGALAFRRALGFARGGA